MKAHSPEAKGTYIFSTTYICIILCKDNQKDKKLIIRIKYNI